MSKQKIHAANNPLLKGLLMGTEFPKSHFITFKPAKFIRAILRLLLRQRRGTRCVPAQHRFISSGSAQLHSMHRGGWRMQTSVSCCAHNPETSRHCTVPSSCGAFFWKCPLRGAAGAASEPRHGRLRLAPRTGRAGRGRRGSPLLEPYIVNIAIT